MSDGGEIDAVRALHGRVDAAVAHLAGRHVDRLQCRLGCNACCVDDISVFEVEAERIRAEFPDVLTGAPGPRGACAFLGADGECRVYAARPYVCRTQGLPLRWHAQQADGVVELRDICELNDAGVPLESLPTDDCWLLGPVEGELAGLQAGAGRAGLRVMLRDLFAG